MRRLKLLIVLFMSIVLLVFAIDMYWFIRVGTSLQEVEENAVYRYLIDIDSGSLALFMSAKIVITILVVFCFITIYNYKLYWALWISCSLAIFQLGLLLYLYVVTPNMVPYLVGAAR